MIGPDGSKSKYIITSTMRQISQRTSSGGSLALTDTVPWQVDHQGLVPKVTETVADTESSPGS